MKKVFKVKQKVFFIIFKGLSVGKIFSQTYECAFKRKELPIVKFRNYKNIELVRATEQHENLKMSKIP